MEISPHFVTFYSFDPISGSFLHDQILQGKIDPTRDMLPIEITQRLANEAYWQFYFRPTFIFQRLKALFLFPKREISMLLSGVQMVLSFWLKRRSRFLNSLLKKRKTEFEVR